MVGWLWQDGVGGEAGGEAGTPAHLTQTVVVRVTDLMNPGGVGFEGETFSLVSERAKFEVPLKYTSPRTLNRK